MTGSDEKNQNKNKKNNTHVFLAAAAAAVVVLVLMLLLVVAVCAALAARSRSSLFTTSDRDPISDDQINQNRQTDRQRTYRCSRCCCCCSWPVAVAATLDLTKKARPRTGMTTG